MRIYDNETSKIYPDLDTTAPEEPQTYRLKKLTEIEILKSKSFKILTVEQEKHIAIKLLAQSKLDSIADIISEAMQDGDISSIEFYKVLQEVKKYRKF